MKATELRIGNWVNVLHGDVQIERFVTEGAHFTDGCGGNFLSLSPIPLTEEWLTRFGFFELDKPNVFYLSYQPHEVHKVGPDRFQYHATTTTGITVEYVHTLQNLFFALTGQELTIKEPAHEKPT